MRWDPAAVQPPTGHRRGVIAVLTGSRKGSSSANEERFHASIETLIDPFALLTALRDEAGGIVDFVYEYANEAACETNVLGREELVGTRLLERVTQLAPVGLFDEYVTVIETCEPLALDDFAQPNRRGGEPDQRCFDVRALRAGELLVLTWRDVTERDRAELDQARLATIVRSSYDAITSFDADLRIASWNSGAQALHGYDAEEVLGSSGEVLIPPDATLESRGLRERILTGGDVRRYETQRLHRDGTLIDVEITAFVLVDAAGKAAGATAITRDISKHKRAERALAESDERYREILDTTPEGVWRVDAEEHTDYVNPRMASMLGYSPQEMIGRKLSEFMDPEQFEIAQQEMATAREDMRLGVVENSFVRKDGTRCWAGVSHTALTDLHGNHTGGLVDHVRHHRVKSPS
jgi:PAS domain S-box-containing protein